MVWLDLDAKPALNTGTPSVEAHWGAVGSLESIFRISIYVKKWWEFSILG